MNFVDLVDFVIAWEEREQRYHFEQHTADAPQIHLVTIVAISKQTLWGPIPSGRDVLGEGRLGVDSTTGPEVSQFDLIVFNQNVLSMKEK